MTIEEVLLLTQTQWTGRGGTGVYIETKLPAFHRPVPLSGVLGACACMLSRAAPKGIYEL